MLLARPRHHAARGRRGAARLAGLAALLSAGLLLPTTGAQAATEVGLGTAESFAILAGTTITNTGPTVVAGDIGLHPGTAVAGFGPGADQVIQEGSQHLADGVALQAKNDLVTAYTDAAGQTPVTRIATELGTTTLTAGVYDSAAGTFGVTGPLTLDGEGDPDAVFVFQMASTLTTASASSVNLINGADLCNVFWQVGSSATLGGNSTFVGTIMALQSVSLTTGATVQGRVLARNGAVTLDTNTITASACAAPSDDGSGTPVEDDGNGTPVEGDGTGTPVEDDGTGTPVEGDGTGTPVEGDAADENGTPVEGDAPDGGVPTDGSSANGSVPGGGAGSATEDGGTPTGGAGATSDGGTTGQITAVPSGGVAAGGGLDTALGLPGLLAWTLALVALGCTAGIATRRRVRT